MVGKTHFDTAAHVAKDMVLQHVKNPIPSQYLININIPDLPLEQLAGTQVTRLGARHHAENMIKQLDPRGQEVYWLGPPGKEADAGEGTDFYAIEKGEVSITPLRVDLTAHEAMQHMRAWVNP